MANIFPDISFSLVVTFSYFHCYSKQEKTEMLPDISTSIHPSLFLRGSAENVGNAFVIENKACNVCVLLCLKFDLWSLGETNQKWNTYRVEVKMHTTVAMLK